MSMCNDTYVALGGGPVVDIVNLGSLCKVGRRIECRRNGPLPIIKTLIFYLPSPKYSNF